MCGIAIVVGNHLDSVREAIARMTRASHHRGPDDEGTHFITLASGRVLGMGFRRLAIRDLSPAGHQPMVDRASGCVVVFNGEVYNFSELRAELTRLGWCFLGNSDTEIVLAGYLHWGDSLFRRLAGMYAIGLFDPRSSRLLLARDPLGIKPIYTARTGDSLVVGSELATLRASGLVDTSVDISALATFMAYGAVQEPLTALRAAKALRPGVFETIDLGSHALRRTEQTFWTYPRASGESAGTTNSRKLIGDLLRVGLKDHLAADVPIGVLLSSGIDSTSILKLASEATSKRIDAFTISVGGVIHDEAPVARESARRYGARFHQIEVSDADAASAYESWLACMDQPTVDGLNTYLVTSAVRRAGIKVALSGLGADELFGGYRSFRSGPLGALVSRGAALAPRGWRRAIPQWVARATRGDQRPVKALEFALLPEGDAVRATLRTRRLFSDASLELLGFPAPDALGLTTDWLPPDHALNHPAEVDGSAAVRQAELLGYMRNMLLRDADVFSMAVGLELRVPFLDQRLVDQVLKLRLPPWRDQPSKAVVLGDAIGGLPHAVRHGQKRGFAMDYARFGGGNLPSSIRAPVDAFVRGSPRSLASGASRTLRLDTIRGLAVVLGQRWLS